MLVALLIAGCAGGGSAASGGGGNNDTDHVPDPGDPVFSAAGADPGGMAAAGDGRLAFASYARGRVEVLNLAAGTVTKSTLVSGGPIRAAFAPDGTLFVALLDEGAVVRFDGDLAEVARVSVGRQPRSIALDAARSRLYVALFGEDRLKVLDSSTLEAKGEFATGRGPRFVVVQPATGNVLVGSALDGQLRLFSPDGDELARTSVGLTPTSGAVRAANNSFVVTDYARGKVFELADRTLATQREFDVAFGATGIGVDAARGTYLTGNALLPQLDRNSFADGGQFSYPSPTPIQGIFVIPGGTGAISADYVNGRLYSLDLDSGTFAGPID